MNERSVVDLSYLTQAAGYGSRRRLLKAAAGGAIAGAGIVGLSGTLARSAAAAGGGPVPTRQFGRTQAGVDWYANHDMDGDQYQAEYDSMSAQGWRLRRVSGYSIDGVDYYASIWELSSGPSWFGRHRIDGDEYQATFEEYRDQGYRPIDVSGYEKNGTDYYAAIFEQSNNGTMEVRHRISGDDYQALVDGIGQSGYRPLHVCGYNVGGRDLYATLWEASPGPGWASVHRLDRAGFQEQFEILTAQGYWPIDISGYVMNGGETYAGIFEQSSGVDWIIKHGVENDTYRADFQDFRNQGFRLRSITAFGIGGRALFSEVWDKQGPGDLATGGVEAIDELARKLLDERAVPGLQIAIAKDGALVHAQAYGYADPDAGEAMRNDHVMRIASVSKPITSAAIMSLIENGSLSLDQTIFGENGILGTDYGTQPYAPELEEITLEHLLTHTSGSWENRPGEDPMFQRTDIFGDEFISWVLDTYPLENPPGTNMAYSNFGYCLLGRVIEYTTGQSYEDYVRDNILAACGIFDMQIAGDTLADRLPNEAVYDGTNFPPEDPYELPVTRMDAHGGWLGSATDLVRFAARVDRFPSVPDILGDATIAEMITPGPAGGNYAKGWLVNQFDNWWHDGLLAGTQSWLVRANNGFIFAAVMNGNGLDFGAGDSPLWEQMINLVDEWPAGEPL